MIDHDTRLLLEHQATQLSNAALAGYLVEVLDSDELHILATEAARRLDRIERHQYGAARLTEPWR